MLSSVDRDVIQDWLEQHAGYGSQWRWGALQEVLERLIESDREARERRHEDNPNYSLGN